MNEWRSCGLRVAMSVAAGVLTMEFVGLVTPAVSLDFCLTSTPPKGAHSALVRFDRATVVMGPEEMVRIVQGAAGKRGRLPAAILCRPADLALFQVYARQCAEAGLTRSVFTNLVAAQDWALRRASAARMARLSQLGIRSPFRAAA